MISDHTHPDLQVAVLKVSDARAELHKELARIQAACKHDKVIELPYSSSAFCQSFHEARRLCLVCGKEEEAKYDQYKVLNVEFIKKVTSDEFFSSRIG